ncbi:MAG: PP2C family protein-serine/threonine phosphatase [Symploca sp. SIO1B1]|nr:PP2C family protein-serine/threonine phosphatase [Symploca sp. SIO1C2]NER94088.1 PP2C family protein-serine/threonine phosphatase [Symploca sp. SIO1B1]
MVNLGQIQLNHQSYLHDIRQNVWQLVKILTEDEIIATRLSTITSQINRLMIDSGINPALSIQLETQSHFTELSLIFITKNQIPIPNLIYPFFDQVKLLISENKYYQIKADYFLKNHKLLTEQRIREAQAIFTQKSREQLMSELEEKNQVLQESLLNIKRMGAELDVAKQIQSMVLPKEEELAEIANIDIVGYMKPADEVGGDYYDVLYSDGVVTIGIGDVTGHGLESGILMLMTQTAVRTLQEIKESNPVRFLDTLNRTIYHNVQRMNSEKNLTLAILNYSEGIVSISGQHEETLVIRSGGEQIERIDMMDLGLPIGIDDDIADFIDQTTVELHAGDGIVLYTDGIPEAYNPEKKQYGMERFCEVISQNWQGTAQEVKQAVIDDVREFIGTQKVFDDITLVVLKQQ